MARYWWNPKTERLEPYSPSTTVEAKDLVFNDSSYDGLRAQDGTPINTRKKHRQYMKDNNLTTMDDYKGVWAKKQAEMDARRAGTFRDPERGREIREEIGKAWWKNINRKSS